MLNFNIISLFPEFFDSPLSTSLLGRAARTGLLSFSFFNPRNFTLRKHGYVDDKPFGGGAGMVMQVQPLYSALKSIQNPGKILLMSPSGKKFSHVCAQKLAKESSLTLICGRYEGVDSRILKLFPIEPVSVCDAVLNGGECAALCVIEAVSRFLPNFIGKAESLCEESFSNGILEYDQYTQPADFMGFSTPQILKEGNHVKIKEWKRQSSLKNTLAIRPDLLNSTPLSASDAEYLGTLPRLRPGRNISFCLLHHPVIIDNKTSGISSLTNLDIHDIARVSKSYGMGPFFVYTPLTDQLNILYSILDHWLTGEKKSSSDRAMALSQVCPVNSFQELYTKIFNYYGREGIFIVTSAQWPARKAGKELLAPDNILELSRIKPVIICLGTARGLSLKELPFEYAMLRPLRFLDENHLSVRSAAAIIADRILGDFY